MPPKVKETDRSTIIKQQTSPIRRSNGSVSVVEQDMYVPLSENLIIGFFMDMIHDFPESSVFTKNPETDIEYLIMMFDSVFRQYWFNCEYTLRQIVSFLTRKPEEKVSVDNTSAKSKVEKARPSREAASVPVNYSDSSDTKTKVKSLDKKFMERAHEFFYHLVSRQGLNDGILTFNYDEKSNKGNMVSSKNGDIITDINKVAGGGRGLPSNHFFGSFIDSQVQIQSVLEANVTSGCIFKRYSDARKGSNVQSFTAAAIKAMNLGSPPDYTDSMGSWDRYESAPVSQNIRSPTTPIKRGGALLQSGISDDSDIDSVTGSSNTVQTDTISDAVTMNVLTNTSSDRQPSAKPMFVVEDALASSTQLPATFALNNRFVFSVGKNNQFNLVPIKSTAEKYDMAAKKLQTPPELYDMGLNKRDEVLTRIATRQASCYDYFYRKFNLKFGNFNNMPTITPQLKYGIPIAGQNQRTSWKEFVTVTIGPNKVISDNTANLVLKMAVGTNAILSELDDNGIFLSSERNNWAKKFINYLTSSTQDSEQFVTDKFTQTSSDGQDEINKIASDTLSELKRGLEIKRSENIDLLGKDKLQLDYLYNFSFDKLSDFTPLPSGMLFPSYFGMNKDSNEVKSGRVTIKHQERAFLATQLISVVYLWLERRLIYYQVGKDSLREKFIDVLTKKDNNFNITTNELKKTEVSDWPTFVGFIVLCQNLKSAKLKSAARKISKKLWSGVIPVKSKDSINDQFETSIQFILTIIFNLRILEFCFRQLTTTGKGDDGSFQESIMNDVWIPSANIYLTPIVMNGCSNDSEIVVSPDGEENSNTVKVQVVGDTEESLKQEISDDASVAAVLNRWRLGIISAAFGESSKELEGPEQKKQRKGGAKDAKITTQKKVKPVEGPRQKLERLSIESSNAGRKGGVDDDLTDWLQKEIREAMNMSPEKRKGGFTPSELRKSFAILFQKTSGDFFQVKLSQFLNDTSSCFTCNTGQGSTCTLSKNDFNYDRSVYRPYAENPDGPKDSRGILVATDAFYQNFERPIMASSVQLFTFDIMAGLIGLQQTANVVIQTRTKTTISNGAVLYSISNITAPVRDYIDTRLAELNLNEDGDNMEEDEDDDEKEKEKPKTKSSQETKTDDEETANEKMVDITKIPKIVLDIDLLSVLRKVPADVTVVASLTSFLYNNDLSGEKLNQILDLPYSDFNTLNYDMQANDEIKSETYMWKSILRLLFDFMCYYQGMRPEESLARAKVCTYVLSNAFYSAKNNPNPISKFENTDIYNACRSFAAAMTTAESLVKPSLVDMNESSQLVSPRLHTKLSSRSVIAPTLPKSFAENVSFLNAKKTDDPVTERAFKTVIELLQKAAFDKEITEADNRADKESDKYKDYTRQWLELFSKIETQSKEMDAIESLLAISQSATSETTDSPLTEEYIESDEAEAEDDETTLGKKRARNTFGGTRRNKYRNHKIKPKHRTIRSSTHSSSSKTLTQVLRELSLGT